ncbi:MAG: hypothetical protein ABIA59_03210 [Candidatus Latescibacterota bacterium]
MNRRAGDAAPEKIQQMVSLALRTLASLYKDGDTLCCRTLRANHKGIERIGVSVRYSAISLIGILTAAKNGYYADVDRARLTDRLILEARNEYNVGNLGLICWVAALSDEHDRCNHQLQNFLPERLRDLSKVDTSMELQWLLTGTCNLYIRCPDHAWLEDIIERTYDKLARNLNDRADMFCGQTTGRIKSRWKKNLCYFSDQVYGIYSLCTYYEAFGNAEALEWSVRIARKICSLQGDRGQWPWLYDSRKGGVVSMYPVYSVHQDGMAPMALFKLSEVSDVDFTQNVMQGLSWVLGENELNIPLIDMSRGVIWRSIRKETKLDYRYALKVIKLVHVAGLDWLQHLANPFLSYEIDMECRPYHLGWLLCAFSGRC